MKMVNQLTIRRKLWHVDDCNQNRSSW